MVLKFLENKLVLASHNKGKLKELYALLRPYNMTLLSVEGFNLTDPIEDGDSFEANALLKAKFVAEATGLPALADDSGLCVKALDGRPGIYSARWAGEAKNFGSAMTKVNDLLDEAEDRSAYFISVLALVLPNEQEYFFKGICHGNLIWPPRGKGGFGYGSMFIPDGHEHTFAEMSESEKTELSHRAKAMHEFIQFCFR